MGGSQAVFVLFGAGGPRMGCAWEAHVCRLGPVLLTRTLAKGDAEVCPAQRFLSSEGHGTVPSDGSNSSSPQQNAHSHSSLNVTSEGLWGPALAPPHPPVSHSQLWERRETAPCFLPRLPTSKSSQGFLGVRTENSGGQEEKTKRL